MLAISEFRSALINDKIRKKNFSMLDNIRIVLVNPSHPGNIGSVARAMKTMSLSQLYLINPKAFPHPKALEMATNAEDLLAKAQIRASLFEAIKECTLVIGTSARMRKIPWPLVTPREAALDAIHSAAQSPVAILFGCEQFGLTNEALERCHLHMQIPTNPNFSSLNLAAAVQVIAYELYIASISNMTNSKNIQLPTQSEITNFFHHLQKVLTDIHFLKSHAPRKLMTRLRRFFMRASPDKMELNLLRGILSAIEKAVHKD